VRRPKGTSILKWSAVALVVAAAATGLVLWRYPSDTYVLIPDNAHPAAPIITVSRAKQRTDTGGIYFLDVIERKATLLEDMFHGTAPSGASFLPPAEITPPGVSESQTVQVDLGEMALSQQIAAAVGERAAGYKVTTNPSGARVIEIIGGEPADGKLLPGDVIVSVDGQPVKTSSAARAALRRRKPGDSVRLGVRNRSGLRTVDIKTIADPQNKSIPIVGILIDQAAQIHLPVPVNIKTGNIGGPSAGLAFALEVLQKLGKNVDHGYKVAATGEIFLDGAVGPIGGAEQKAIGARNSGVEVMLVPAGDNARIARKYAGKMKIIPVESFRQALHALATLPPKR
jgi:PDZ domain-containing protein